MRPERRHTLCASLSSRNAFQHVTRAAPYGNLQVTRRRPEWGAPRSGTCLYTYRKNPSVWTNCLGNQKTDCNCLPACHFWTSGLVAGPGTRAPGHNPDPRAHGHTGTTPIHGHTGTRAKPTREPTSKKPVDLHFEHQNPPGSPGWHWKFSVWWHMLIAGEAQRNPRPWKVRLSHLHLFVSTHLSGLWIARLSELISDLILVSSPFSGCNQERDHPLCCFFHPPPKPRKHLWTKLNQVFANHVKVVWSEAASSAACGPSGPSGPSPSGLCMSAWKSDGRAQFCRPRRDGHVRIQMVAMSHGYVWLCHWNTTFFQQSIPRGTL
jgi:hypothetical protein